jgi:DUF1365 family protein
MPTIAITEQERLKQLLTAINRQRSNIVTFAERLVGDSPEWESLRSRILSAFGDRGLERDVRQIMNSFNKEKEKTCEQ